MMFALGQLSLIESTEIRIEANGNVGGNEQCASKVRRTSFTHAIVRCFKLARLGNGCIDSCIGNEFGRRFKAMNVANLAKNNRAQHRPMPGIVVIGEFSFSIMAAISASVSDTCCSIKRICSSRARIWKEKVSLQWVTPKECLAASRSC